MATFEQRVEQHEKLEALIKEKQDAAKAALAPLLILRAKVRAELLQMLNDTGQDSAKTENGTVSRVVKTTAVIEDLEAFQEYVIEAEQWQMLDWKCNSTEAKERAESELGLPPGVRLNQSVDISVRTASAPRKPRSTVRPTKSNPFPEEVTA